MAHCWLLSVVCGRRFKGAGPAGPGLRWHVMMLLKFDWVNLREEVEIILKRKTLTGIFMRLIAGCWYVQAISMILDDISVHSFPVLFS